MILLIPGRHHLMTNFQYHYLESIIQKGLSNVADVEGNPLNIETPVTGLVFAITSANHYGTKRNPLPFYLRAMMVHDFCRTMSIPNYIYGIDDVGIIDDFANYTLKQIAHQSEYQLDLQPHNCLVVCSTPVLDMYRQLGFTILPAELMDSTSQTYSHPLPWYWVEQIGQDEGWKENQDVLSQVHNSGVSLWQTYKLGQKVNQILSDPIIGEDGDITESRDYNSYVRQMDEIADIKFADTQPFIQVGNVGDIGCAVGSWIKLASEDKRLAECDFYGIEVARQLYNICKQRKENGDYNNANVFFAQKNAVTDLVFRPESMHTIHCSSLTHEVHSYGSMQDLITFIQNRYDELANAGVWINRDVVGPEDGDDVVLLWLNEHDGNNDNIYQEFEDQKQLGDHLSQLSSWARFLRFSKDFRQEEHEEVAYNIVELKGRRFVELKRRDACEFMLTKDYVYNWYSEMHERFCFWSYTDWQAALQTVGFHILPGSGAYTNPWIAQNRFKGKVRMYQFIDDQLEPEPDPPTNILIVGQKR